MRALSGSAAAGQPRAAPVPVRRRELVRAGGGGGGGRRGRAGERAAVSASGAPASPLCRGRGGDAGEPRSAQVTRAGSSPAAPAAAARRRPGGERAHGPGEPLPPARGCSLRSRLAAARGEGRVLGCVPALRQAEPGRPRGPGALQVRGSGPKPVLQEEAAERNSCLPRARFPSAARVCRRASC